jgi:hypothetical protein
VRATLALHYAAIDWVGGRLSAQTHRPSELPPSLMTAQLRLALPKRVASKPLESGAAGASAAPRKPAAQAAPPVERGSAGCTASSAATAVAASEWRRRWLRRWRRRAGRAPQAQTGTPPPAVAQGETPAAVVPEAAPRQGMRRYKVNLPPSASFDMTVDRVDADGTKWTGSATMTWHTDGSRYAPRWRRASAC